MAKVRLHFKKIWDKDGNLDEIKTDSVEELKSFVRRHKGEIKGLHSGSKTVSEKKFEEMKKEENFK